MGEDPSNPPESPNPEGIDLGEAVKESMRDERPTEPLGEKELQKIRDEAPPIENPLRLRPGVHIGLDNGSETPSNQGNGIMPPPPSQKEVDEAAAWLRERAQEIGGEATDSGQIVLGIPAEDTTPDATDTEQDPPKK